MRLIRGKRDREVVHDPWGGKGHPISQSDTAHTLDERGGIASHGSVHRRACDCGCLRPPAGFCSECRGTACGVCFGFCLRCARPLCPAHSVFRVIERGQRVRLCQGCHGSLRRKRVIRGLLSPFVRWEKSTDGL